MEHPKTEEPKMDEGYYQLLYQLQVVEFTILELNLYLDTHPCDQQAIYQFNQCSYQLQQLKHDFECKYGPLTNFGFSYMEPGKEWYQGPWPWEV
ncbi:spore coat protein CotJB [Mechercharimyces sp. CAU 1602]|uniref:spore coat protein CotJB n=1 Tax=Mechercharimyces sp. CAU 1602 TaxID=2973933 RepID=UPI0021632524|nr:spore coat protein CotJB [Mechercharimyces sp. CAU 1602]MCS1350192.1 spore coat protein CotJB [Mechercharimyces sp. CAU 1602]